MANGEYSRDQNLPHTHNETIQRPVPARVATRDTVPDLPQRSERRLDPPRAIFDAALGERARAREPSPCPERHGLGSGEVSDPSHSEKHDSGTGTISKSQTYSTQDDITPRTCDAPGTEQVSNRESSVPLTAEATPGTSSSALQTSDLNPVRRRLPPKTRFPSPLGRTPQTNSNLQRRTGILTVHDLGLDYSRYYDPFARSARASMVGRSSRTSFETCSSGRPLLSNAHPKINITGLPDTPPESPESSNQSSNSSITEQKIFFIDDRLGAPYDEQDGLAWPLWGDEAEDDDAMHLPHPDDDKIFQLHWKEYFSRENIARTIGATLMVAGAFIIVFGLPVLVFTGVIDYSGMYDSPLDDRLSGTPHKGDWAWVNGRAYPYLQNVRSGLIDPDTPDYAMWKLGEFGDEYELVFSDEFNDPNRTFYKGDDPYFFAPDIWYGATQDLEWYDPDALTTWDGVLEIRMDRYKNHGLDFRSGMLNSWNQLCFKGGIFEVSVSLPGPAGIHGLWPGIWTLGNLGRPGYMATTDGTWPYTYQACDAGITPNQSSSDGLSWLPGMRLPSCTCPGEDHPSPGTGRGVPEIDIAEVSVSYVGDKLPVATQSYQVAPFDIWYYPDYNFTAFPDHRLSYLNTYTGGPFQQAISTTTNLNLDWYDGKAYQRFSYEYVPGDGEHAYINWKVGGQTMFHLDGRAIGPNGNVQARQISQEPMTIVLNLGISNSWTWINWEELIFPTVLRVDYVRWYQKKGETMVTCDPPGFETTKYIEEHLEAYMNPNLTRWDQTGYGWPKHKLNSDC